MQIEEAELHAQYVTDKETAEDIALPIITSVSKTVRDGWFVAVYSECSRIISKQEVRNKPCSCVVCHHAGGADLLDA